MFKNITTISALALLMVSCSGDSRIETRALPQPNPTSYTFPMPLAELRSKALDAFSIEHQVDKPIFGRSSIEMHLEDTFSAECSTNVVFSKTIFTNLANTNDIYLHTFGIPFVASPVYRGRNGGLPFGGAFHLHLTENGSNTVVSVSALDTAVVNGKKFGIGPCGPGYGEVFEKVAPTTVEEYSILRYLGAYLGVTNMPAVILPAP